MVVRPLPAAATSSSPLKAARSIGLKAIAKGAREPEMANATPVVN
jgi:hypothetical protein